MRANSVERRRRDKEKDETRVTQECELKEDKDIRVKGRGDGSENVKE